MFSNFRKESATISLEPLIYSSDLRLFLNVPGISYNSSFMNDGNAGDWLAYSNYKLWYSITFQCTAISQHQSQFLSLALVADLCNLSKHLFPSPWHYRGGVRYVQGAHRLSSKKLEDYRTIFWQFIDLYRILRLIAKVQQLTETGSQDFGHHL